MGLVIFITGLGALAVAVQLLRRGFEWRNLARGVCPRCRYTICGLPADASRCPECGESTLREPGVEAERAKAAIGVAVVLTLIGALMAGFSATTAWRDALVGMTRLSSTASLANRVMTERDPFSLGARTTRKELDRRWRTGSMSLADFERIGAAAALRYQTIPFNFSEDLLTPLVASGIAPDKLDARADALRNGVLRAARTTTGPVPQEIQDSLAELLQSNTLAAQQRADLIDAMHSTVLAASYGMWTVRQAFLAEVVAGRIDMHDLARLALAEIDPRLEVATSEPVRPGGLFALAVPMGRPGGQMSLPAAITLDIAGDARDWTRLNDGSDGVGGVPQRSMVVWADERAIGSTALHAWLVAPSVPGEHEIEGRVTVRLMQLTTSEYDDFIDLAQPNPPLLAFSFVVRTTIRIEGEPFPPPRLVETPFHRPDFGDCDRCGNYAWRSPYSDLVGVKLLLDTAPIDVAADVFLEQDGVEHPIGWVYITPERRWATVVGAAPDIRPGPVNIILRPNITPLPTFDPRRLLYEKELVIPTKVSQPGAEAVERANPE